MPQRKPNNLRRVATPAVALLASAITACAPVGPDFVRPEVPLNPEWLDAELAAFDSDAADLTEWWKTLDDPVLDRERGESR